MDYCPKEFSLYWLNEQLGNDEPFAQEALVMLRRGAAMNWPEHARGTFTLATSATRLVDDWLSEGRLFGYSRGKRIENFLALTVIPFEGDVEKGIQNLDAMITIKRDELIALMTEEGIDRLPDCLRLTDTAANDGFAQKRMPPNLSIWGAKDLWSVTEFALLLCGAEPGGRGRGRGRTARLSNTELDTTMRAIKLAVAAETLTVAHLQQVPMGWGSFEVPHTEPYFRPGDAIIWANSRRAEFPHFPQFVVRNDRPSEPISTDENLCALEELVSNGGPVNWVKWHRMRSLRPDEAAKLISCIDPIRWKGDQYAQGPIPQTLLDKIEHCREHLSRIDDKWTFAKLAEELPGELPAGMLEALRPAEPPAQVSKAVGEDHQEHWVDREALIKAFGCRKEIFLESAAKSPWLIDARIKGRGGKNPVAARYDPVAFTNNLPGTAYAPNLTSERAWKILKQSFPLSYDDVSQFDPNDSK